jgi:hypothetical protein
MTNEAISSKECKRTARNGTTTLPSDAHVCSKQHAEICQPCVAQAFTSHMLRQGAYFPRDCVLHWGQEN